MCGSRKWAFIAALLPDPAPDVTRLDILFYRSYEFRCPELLNPRELLKVNWFEGIIANSLEIKNCCNSDDKQVVEREIRNNEFKYMATRALKIDLLTFFNCPAQFSNSSVNGKWS